MTTSFPTALRAAIWAIASPPCSSFQVRLTLGAIFPSLQNRNRVSICAAFAARDPKANAAHVDELFRLWRMGQIAPRVSATYPLARGGEAIAALGARSVIGKVVVTLD